MELIMNDTNTNLNSIIYADYIERDEQWVEVAKRLAEAKKFIKYYSEIEDEYIEKLKALSEGQSSRGGGYLYQKIKTKGLVDYLAIPGVKEVAENYRKPDRESWRFDREK